MHTVIENNFFPVKYIHYLKNTIIYLEIIMYDFY
jgi:hypothetical protein